MALGTAAILGLGSVAGAVVQGRSASKAADAQSDAASEANETQRYIFDQQVALTEPQRVMGQNALAALGFEAGIAPLPTFGGTQSGNMGNALAGSPLTIEEIQGTGAGNLTFTGAPDNQTAFLDGRVVASEVNNQAEVDRLRAMYGGQGGQSSFRVGDQTFGTRQEAEAFVNSQSMGPQTTGGMQYTPIQFPDDPNTGLDAFEASPGYQFRLDEGMKAIERAASARGLRLSGSALMDAARFNQGTASNEFGNFYNRTMNDYGRQYGEAMDSRNLLSSIAGLGQTATQQQLGAGTNFANATSGNLLNMGNAQAAGYQGMANAVTGGINNLSNIYGMGMSGYLGQNPGLGIKPVANPFGG